MGATATQGKGTTITFGTSNFTSNLLDVGGPSATRGSVETTHLATTGGKTFDPAALYDGGEISVTWQYTPDDVPPIDQPAETVTIAFAGVTGLVVTAFMTAYSITSSTTEENMQATATLKVSGTIAYS